MDRSHTVEELHFRNGGNLMGGGGMGQKLPLQCGGDYANCSYPLNLCPEALLMVHG